jgi:hypothetical protein
VKEKLEEALFMRLPRKGVRCWRPPAVDTAHSRGGRGDIRRLQGLIGATAGYIA